MPSFLPTLAPSLKLGDRDKAEHFLRESVSLHRNGSEQAPVLLADLGRTTSGE